MLQISKLKTFTIKKKEKKEEESVECKSTKVTPLWIIEYNYKFFIFSIRKQYRPIKSKKSKSYKNMDMHPTYDIICKYIFNVLKKKSIQIKIIQ